MDGIRVLRCGCEKWGSQVFPCEVHDSVEADEFVEREEAIQALTADDMYELDMNLLEMDV